MGSHRVGHDWNDAAAAAAAAAKVIYFLISYYNKSKECLKFVKILPDLLSQFTV